MNKDKLIVEQSKLETPQFLLTSFILLDQAQYGTLEDTIIASDISFSLMSSSNEKENLNEDSHHSL